MSIWKKLVRAYILVSLVVAGFAAYKFYPLLRPVVQGETPPDVAAVLNDLPQLENVLEKSPLGTPSALMALGVLYQQKEKLEDAERMFKKALSLSPDHADTWFNLGLLYQKKEQLSDAAEAFENCLKTKPDFSQAHNNLAIVYEALGRQEDAFMHYKEALELEPDNPVLRDNFEMAKKERDRGIAEGVMLEANADNIPAQIQAPAAPSESEMKIDVAAPIEEQPYFLRSPKKIVLKNGRSVIGDVVDKDELGMWLETGRGMRIRLSRDEVERIEDVETG